MKLKQVTRKFFTTGILLLTLCIVALVVVLKSAANSLDPIHFYTLMAVFFIMVILMTILLALIEAVEAEKIRSEQKIMQANRLYLFISQINHLIVRTPDEQTLFKEVCRIAVDTGKFRMAWIGLIDEETKSLSSGRCMQEKSSITFHGLVLHLVDKLPEGQGPNGYSDKRRQICSM